MTATTAAAVKEVRTIALTFGQVFALFVAGFLFGAIVMMRGSIEKPAGAATSGSVPSSEVVKAEPSPKG